MRKAIVTGATGYIGSNLVKALLDNDYTVGVICRNSSLLSKLKPYIDKIEVFFTDNSYKSIDSIMKHYRPDIIFHLASKFIPQHKPADVQMIIQSNITFGSLILESMVNNNIKLFVNTGTSWEYYQKNIYDPVNFYASTKKAFEDILVYYISSSDLKAITLKLFDTYGLGDNRRKIVNILIDHIGQDELLDLSPGDQILDLTFIDDVISAYLVAAELLFSGKSGKAEYFVKTNSYTLKQIVKKIIEISGSDMNVSFGSRPYRFREVMCPFQGGDVLPGWEPKFDLSSGIKAILDSRKYEK